MTTYLRNFLIGYLVLVLGIFVGAKVVFAHGEGEHSPRLLINSGALICNTRKQVEHSIATSFIVNVKGCNTTDRDLFVELIFLEPFVYESVRFNIVRFEFPFTTTEGETVWSIKFGLFGQPVKIGESEEPEESEELEDTEDTEELKPTSAIDA